jgi:hypothetical protein
LANGKKFQLREKRRRRSQTRTQFPPAPEQIALPPDYLKSERAAPSQNLERWIGIRARRRLARLATTPAIHELLDIVPASLENTNANENIRQRQ